MQAPDFLVDALLKLLRLVRSGHSQLSQQLVKFAGTSEPQEALTALKVASKRMDNVPENLPSSYAQELAEAYRVQSADPVFQKEVAVWDSVASDE